MRVSAHKSLARNWFEKAAALGKARSSTSARDGRPQTHGFNMLSFVPFVRLSAQPSTTASVANIIVTAITTMMVSRVIRLLHALWKKRYWRRERSALR
jgi:hypothetical protein